MSILTCVENKRMRVCSSMTQDGQSRALKFETKPTGRTSARVHPHLTPYARTQEELGYDLKHPTYREGMRAQLLEEQVSSNEAL